jgi:enoyl-CoA hydratase/carnithine racemase
MTRRVTVNVRDAVGYVALTRADKRNRLDLEMLRALVAAAGGARADRTVQAVILRGDGPSFRAGLGFVSAGRQPLRMAARAAVGAGERPRFRPRRVDW